MKPLGVSVYRSPVRSAGSFEGLAYGVVAFVGICAILYFGKDILIPITLAVLLSVLLAPVVKALQRIRFPKPAAVLSVVMMFVLAAGLTGYLVAHTLANLAADLPAYEASLREKARSVKILTSNSDTMERAAGVLEKLQTELTGPAPAGAAAPQDVKPIPVELRDNRFGPLAPVMSVIGVIAHPMVQAGIVILMLSFMLFNRQDLRDRFIQLIGTGDLHRTTVAMDEAGKRLSRLFIGLLTINASVGAALAAALFLLGVPGAFLWGLLTAILRFVPFVGTFLASILPIVIALAVGDGWTLPLIVAVVVIVLEVTAGHVLEPIFLGKMTGVSSTAIVVSAAFWAMIWGPVGLILATPITIGLLVIGRNIESLRFLSVLFGSEPVLSPDRALYQRLLAGDSVEGAQAAMRHAEDGRLQAYLDEVAIPALMIADADMKREALSRDAAATVASTFSDTLDEIWEDEEKFETDPAPVIVVANHGPINFAAAVAFSALLHLRKIPHRMLPQNAISPGQFPEVDTAPLRFVCLVSLHAQGKAQLHYIERRLAGKIGKARLVNVAWRDGSGTGASLLAQNVTSLLPHARQDADTAKENVPAAVPAVS